MKPALLLPLALLAACSQNPDGSTAFGVTGSPAWFLTASPEAITEHYRGRCQSYGHQPGTDGMLRCIEQSAERERVAGRQGMAEAMSRFGQQQAESARAWQMSAPQYRPSPVTCQSYSYAGTGYTTVSCY